MSECVDRKLLHKWLNYDPSSGQFNWIDCPRKSIRVGAAAGSDHKDGYLHICISGKHYLCHRLAWFYVHGYWPPNEVDHINGDKKDNRLSNLRLATKSQNRRNVTAYKNNTSGRKGVCWRKSSQKWSAKIQVNKKQINLGLYDTVDEAHKAYCDASVKYHGVYGKI